MDGPAHEVIRAVTVTDLGERLVDGREFAVWAGGHVAEGQHVGQGVRRGLELESQDVGKTSFFGFDDGARVVGDESAQHGVSVLGVPQVPGAVERVETRRDQAGRVADVVQPGSGFQEISLSTKDRRQAAGLPGHAPDVRPAAGEGRLEESLGEMLGP